MSRTPTTALAPVDGTSVAPAATMKPVKTAQVADNFTNLPTLLLISSPSRSRTHTSHPRLPFVGDRRPEDFQSFGSRRLLYEGERES
jgi:hypothetical protein